MFKKLQTTIFIIVTCILLVLSIHWITTASATENKQVTKAEADQLIQGYSGRLNDQYSTIHSETLVLSSGTTINYFENSGDRCYVTNTGSISCVSRGGRY